MIKNKYKKKKQGNKQKVNNKRKKIMRNQYIVYELVSEINNRYKLLRENKDDYKEIGSCVDEVIYI